MEDYRNLKRRVTKSCADMNSIIVDLDNRVDHLSFADMYRLSDKLLKIIEELRIEGDVE